MPNHVNCCVYVQGRHRVSASQGFRRTSWRLEACFHVVSRDYGRFVLMCNVIAIVLTE